MKIFEITESLKVLKWKWAEKIARKKDNRQSTNNYNGIP